MNHHRQKGNANVRRLRRTSFDGSTTSAHPLGAFGRFTLALIGALCASMLLGAVPASAAAPVFDSSFTCDAITPCGAITSGFAPDRIAVNDATGDVYAIDPPHDAVVIFNSAGVYQSTIAGSSTDNGSFGFAGFEKDIAIDNSGGANQGHVYVLSEDANKVFAFKADGSFYWQAGAGGDICGVGVNPATGVPYAVDFTIGVRPLSPDDGSVTGTALYGPGHQCEVAFDTKGDSYIRNYDNGSIDKHDSAGALVKTTDDGSSGANLDAATDLTTNDVYLARAADVAVYDSGGAAVSGTPFASTELTGGSGSGVAVNGSASRVYVSDSGHGQIHIYDIPAVVKHTLTVTKGGTGSGSVSSSPGGITCGATCNALFDEGTQVTLTATPAAHSTFTGWSGGGCSGTGTCVVTLNADATVNATFAQDPPAVTTGAASGLTKTSASLAGTVNPNGNATTCQFDYGTTAAYGQSAPCNSNPGSGSSAVGVSATLSGLTPGTTYHYRLEATNSGGTTKDATDHTFTTVVNAPTVTTGSASGISQTAASVGGSVNPNTGNVTDCHIDYGTSASYGSQAACTPSPGSGSSAVNVSAALSGLSTGTAYHFRVVATNAGGTTNGGDATFSTLADTCATNAALCPQPPPRPPHKVLKCKKGFKKQKVHGKQKCVKVKKHHKKHHKKH
jgi:hypothetical protein